jgi:hypothetical protein
VSGKDGGEPDHSAGDAGFVHEVAGEDEEGDGQQREGLGRANYFLDGDGKGNIGGYEEEDYSRDAYGEGYRHSHDEEEQEYQQGH